jgi:hypothetical protein
LADVSVIPCHAIDGHAIAVRGAVEKPFWGSQSKRCKVEPS